MGILTYLTVAVMSAIGGLHAIWGLGISWPLQNEKALVNAVAGFRGIERMPPKSATFTVALLVLLAALIACDLGKISHILPSRIAIAGGIVIAAVFWGRGLLGYTRFWAQLTPEEPFRWLDRLFYSPLCLVLGICYAALLWAN